MTALKGLVVFMGILIAIGVTVVGVTIYRRATDMTAADVPRGAPIATSSRSPSDAPAGGQPLPGFAARDLDLPAGSEIVSVQGVESRVLVHVRMLDTSSRILMLDPVTGAIIGEWRVHGLGSAGGGALRP